MSFKDKLFGNKIFGFGIVLFGNMFCDIFDVEVVVIVEVVW